MADELFPGAVQIVDLFHAKQHLWDSRQGDLRARHRHGRTLGQAAPRRTRRRPARRTAARSAPPRGPERGPRCIDDIRRNRHRMRYPEFRAAGLCVSSGVLEAGCKHPVGQRLKQASMHWTVAGANAIAALRCCKLSHR
ncbi:MAG: hypothetical protein OXH09_07440 [Gammaproteobacteria bacterium]|nr:hypothetical protein [Gammaproteobacteria bacterium]